jgi:lysozyme family protein
MLGAIIKAEGGYVDDPADSGGATNFGITQATLAKWRAPTPVTKEDVQNLTETEARSIYAKMYLSDPGYEAITNEDLRAVMLDCAVQFGPADATAWLQAVLHVPVDGKIGPQTLLALAHEDPRRVALRIMALRIRRRGRRITDHPSQAKFSAGWANRDAALIEGVA